MDLDYLELRVQFPHCDHRVLHEPGKCEYCDVHPDWQQERADKKVNFTGISDPSKTTCPSDEARGLGGAHVWGGNRPASKKGCSCGVSAVGGRHSDYCDLYEHGG